MAVRRIGKGISLAFFLFFSYLPVFAAQEPENYPYPVITRLNPQDISFRQYINDVENNRRRLASARSRGLQGNPEENAGHLTIYQYTPDQGEDLFSLAARCNIPYSAIATLNRLGNPASLEAGKPVLLPSCPGLFIPANFESDLEKLLGMSRYANQESVEIKISAAGVSRPFLFFPGADFTPTERAFFLHSGFFRFPLNDFRLTSAFGLRENPITGNIIMHEGLDLAAPEGTEVFAIADGTVTDLGFDPIYGNYIRITHGNNFTSLYGHLQSIETVLRSTVKSGSLIGRVGSTGQSTGPHLHFELRQDGRPLDPAGRLRH